MSTVHVVQCYIEPDLTCVKQQFASNPSNRWGWDANYREVLLVGQIISGPGKLTRGYPKANKNSREFNMLPLVSQIILFKGYLAALKRAQAVPVSW